MSRRLPFVIFVTAFALAATPQTGDKKGRPNYYPLKEGAKWTYRADVPGQGAETFILQVTKTEKIDGADVFRLETSKQGQFVASEHLSTNDKGVFRNRFNDQAPNKPVTLIKYPVTPGESWDDEVEILGQKMKLSYKVGKETELQVPAGKYKAIPVDIQLNLGELNFANTYWFAPDVGIVKQTADVAGQKVTLELEKYEAGK